MKTVNVDYIAVIQQVNEHVEFVKREIFKNEPLINELKEMVENPNRTVLDLQSRMGHEFRENERSMINYMWPYSYSSTYVPGAVYPKAMAFEDYTNSINSLRSSKTEEVTKRIMGQRKNLKDTNPAQFNLLVKEEVEDAIIRHEKSLKTSYLNDCIRFSNAYCYSQLVNELENDLSVRMYSTESIGWMSKRFEITDDVEITVYTNFGYGYSSYFYISLCYKGIDILPYSFFVNYYYADKRDIARYTRKYNEDNISWDYAFNFVETVANRAKNDENDFVTVFIKNEVDEMMRGLRNIMANPKGYLDRMVLAKNKENSSRYLTIRNISSDEIRDYEVYPHEMVMVFEAEKISGALEFIEGLTELEQIDGNISSVVEEIISMTEKLLPELENNIASVQSEIDRLNKKEEELAAEIESLEKRMEPHVSAINATWEKRRTERNTYNRYDIEYEYKEKHPEYVHLINQAEDKESEKSEVRKDRWAREGFLERLEECRNDIITNK